MVNPPLRDAGRPPGRPVSAETGYGGGGEARNSHGRIPPSTPQEGPMTPPPQRRKDTDLAAHAALLKPSVLSVEALAPDGSVAARGAGFLAGDGRVVTARHLLEGAASVRCRLATGKELPARAVLAEDRVSGVAVLAVDTAGA